MKQQRTPEEIARLAGYLAGLALGVIMVVVGVIRGDWQLIGAGLPLAGLSTVASRNVPATAGQHRPDVE